MSSIDISGAGFALVEEAPNDEKTYGRSSGSWVEIAEPNETLKIIDVRSARVTQLPSTLDEYIIVNFGETDVITEHVSYYANTGTIRFHSMGVYSVVVRVHYGREGGASESNLFVGTLITVDGITNEGPSTMFAKLDNDKIGIPAAYSSFTTITSPDTDVQYTLWRDSIDGGHNSGGLYESTPSRPGGASAPSAAIVIYKM